MHMLYCVMLAFAKPKEPSWFSDWAARLMTECLGAFPDRGKRAFSSPEHPYRL